MFGWHICCLRCRCMPTPSHRPIAEKGTKPTGLTTPSRKSGGGARRRQRRHGRLVTTCLGYPHKDLPASSFTTTAAGRIEVMLEWTLATNNLDVSLYRAPGSTLAGYTISTSTKPEHEVVENAPARHLPAGCYEPWTRGRGVHVSGLPDELIWDDRSSLRAARSVSSRDGWSRESGGRGC